MMKQQTTVIAGLTRNPLILLLLSLFAVSAFAQQPTNYQPLDKSNPVSFQGDYIIYQGEKIALDEKTFFVDGQLSAAEAAKYPYVFNSFNEAAKYLIDGTEAQPMTVYLAPYVYWIDDPDDPAIRKAAEGQRAPFGLVVKCNALSIIGLTSDPKNVVLACNRGQTLGSIGNFTMFSFSGDNLTVENLTMGNYCNVDLEYPLKKELNRLKRSATVVQAQLAFCDGDKITARNAQFISRLNTCPLSGGKRTLFDRCHIECTDDALAPTGVYLNCSFTFFDSKPFYGTRGTGAVLLNCDIDTRVQKKQYLTKAQSPVTIVDTRFHHATDTLFIGWTQDPTDDLRNYQYNVTLNGKPIRMNADKPWLTVDMTDKPLLAAYRFELNNEVIYNTYNLLRGDDDWDPMNIKQKVIQAEQTLGISLTEIPTYLHITPAKATIESGVTDTLLTTEVLRFGNYQHTSLMSPKSLTSLNWNTTQANLVSLNSNQLTCKVSGTNTNDETKTVVVAVTTPLGLEAASVLTVAPPFLDAPAFTSLPKIVDDKQGNLRVNYTLNLERRADESLITWYRCTNAAGENAIPVAVTRLNQPEYIYSLSSGDVGYYIQATVSPKHLRSPEGKTAKAITSQPVSEKQVIRQHLSTNFQNFPVEYQPQILSGFWTVDGYKPPITEDKDWQPILTVSYWRYGSGLDGAKDFGLLQNGKGSRLLFTPVEKKYGDMSLTITVDPCKAAGQGFGIAGQYMDIFIKFDTKTLSGYALRIIRTTKFGRAVDFQLLKYENGMATAISEPVSTTCYRTPCTITVGVKGNRITAHAETSALLQEAKRPGLSETVDVSAEITPNTFGGIGFLHTGTGGANGTVFRQLDVNW